MEFVELKKKCQYNTYVCSVYALVTIIHVFLDTLNDKLDYPIG